MSRGTVRTCGTLALLAAAPLGTALAPRPAPPEADALVREVEHLVAGRELWPGFDPLALPLAVYDGTRTVLFHHPAPPEGFVALEGGEPSAFAYQGRHPELVANGTSVLGGVPTASILLVGGEPRSLRELAAICVHETFHVHQRQRAWEGADESALLAYPEENADLLTLRRLETELLRRALQEPEAELAACWARKALFLRHERFGGMDDAFGAYERATERIEGLATHVEARATGEPVHIPRFGFAPISVRQRACMTGAALAALLDRFQPAWTATFEAQEQPSLDGTLETLLGPAGEEDRCDLATSEIEEIQQVARGDALAVLAERRRQRAAFDRRGGWRVVIEAAEKQPLWPQGLDPLDLERVDGGVLHHHYLRLGNQAAKIEMVEERVDLEALTEGVGPHPSSDGVQRVVFSLPEKPEVLQTSEALVTLRASGLRADLEYVDVEEHENEVVLRLQQSGVIIERVPR